MHIRADAIHCEAPELYTQGEGRCPGRVVTGFAKPPPIRLPARTDEGTVDENRRSTQPAATGDPAPAAISSSCSPQGRQWAAFVGTGRRDTAGSSHEERQRRRLLCVKGSTRRHLGLNHGSTNLQCECQPQKNQVSPLLFTSPLYSGWQLRALQALLALAPVSPVRTLRAPPPVRAPHMPWSATHWSARRAARTPWASSPLQHWGASATLNIRSRPSGLLEPVRATSAPTAPTRRCVRRSASSNIKLEPTGATSSSRRRSGGPPAYGSAPTVRGQTQTAAVLPRGRDAGGRDRRPCASGALCQRLAAEAPASRMAGDPRQRRIRQRLVTSRRRLSAGAAASGGVGNGLQARCQPCSLTGPQGQPDGARMVELGS